MKLGTCRVWVVGAAAAAAAVLVALAAPAFACSVQATVSATATATANGSAVRVSGAGYRTTATQAGAAVAVAPVEIRWGGASGPILATAQVDRSGRFAEQVALPADATDGAYLITSTQALENGGTLKATFALEVDATAAGVRTTSESSAARLTTDARRSFGSPAPSSSPVPPWALAPVALLGGFAVVGGATILARETRQKALVSR